jgi:hypothetical protein
MVLLATASGFEPARDIPFAHLPNLLDASPSVGDVNGDGHLDLVLIHDDYSNNAGVNDGDILTVLEGNGKGQFTEAPRVVMNRRGSVLMDLNDIDRDGKLDLLLGESWSDGPNGAYGFNWPDVDGPSMWVWRGDGQGRFLQPTGAPTLVSTEGGAFAGTGLADIDGDGDLDALLAPSASRRLFVMENRGQGQFGPAAVPDLFFGSKDNWGFNATYWASDRQGIARWPARRCEADAPYRRGPSG